MQLRKKCFVIFKLYLLRRRTKSRRRLVRRARCPLSQLAESRPSTTSLLLGNLLVLVKKDTVRGEDQTILPIPLKRERTERNDPTCSEARNSFSKNHMQTHC